MSGTEDQSKMSHTAAGKEENMDEEMEIDDEIARLLVNVVEENQTRKILLIMRECKDLEEAIAKIKMLLPE